MKYSFLAVDYQKEFCNPIGRFYKERPCHSFIEKSLIPFLYQHPEAKVAEIISDYRLPRPSETVAYCIPGTEGYQSAIPVEVKLDNVWIKAMNSPDWVRENGGSSLETAEPYHDLDAFKHWLYETIGKPNSHLQVVVLGLTLDCCVLCTLQQLYFLGYQALFLWEGVDVYDPSAIKKFIKPEINYKEALLATTHGMFAKSIRWADLKPRLENSFKIRSKQINNSDYSGTFRSRL